jgi:RNA polymerase-interacting CarD/CdnL/TRCF family regulator
MKSPGTGDDLVSPISSTVLDDLSSSGDSVFANAAILGGQSHPLNFSESLTLDLNRFENPGPPESELSNFMLSDSDLELMSRSLPFELGQSGSTLPAGQQSFSSMLEDETDDVEDIIRDSDPGLQLWPVQDSPTLSAHRNSLSDPMLAMLLQEPTPISGSEEMLIVRFDRQTCGILSVKDGAHENPWRTWIWPMAKESPALYHAVFAMAAFHSSKDNPALRVHGMEHMRKSIACLVQGMEQMQTDAALATTLSLAFAESWDQHTSTGIQHLKGAKALMRQTVNSRMRRDMPGNELTRLRFLYNTWLYMDVIARLTSSDEGDNDELITVPFVMPSHSSHQVDPLMGCATTLFPLIGRAANLIQRVRNSESNSFATISEALELKTLIKTWDLPTYFDPPEDPTSELSDSIQTAYAYRSATLLYLHQAVPEIPSESAATLAEETLKYLATVPLSSRTNIVHIFPLLAASCEFEKEKERAWILERWKSMQNRLKIGNIDRCVDVVREVWRRRDSFQAENQRHRRRATSQTDFLSKPIDITASTSARRKSTISGIGRIESEKTVRGRLHWVGVMKDWKWEGNSVSLVFGSRS